MKIGEVFKFWGTSEVQSKIDALEVKLQQSGRPAYEKLLIQAELELLREELQTRVDAI